MRSASNRRGAAVRQPRSATALLLRQLARHKGQLALDGDRLILGGDLPDELQQQLRQHQAELVHELRPKVTAEEAARVRGYLSDAGISVVYVTDAAAARRAADELLRDAVESGVIGIDIETAVRAEHRRPLPIAITKDGRKARRQPKEGDAGLALDPYRARIRLLQAYAGGTSVYVFDLDRVGLAAVQQLDQPRTGPGGVQRHVRAQVPEPGRDRAGLPRVRRDDGLLAHAWLPALARGGGQPLLRHGAAEGAGRVGLVGAGAHARAGRVRGAGCRAVRVAVGGPAARRSTRPTRTRKGLADGCLLGDGAHGAVRHADRHRAAPRAPDRGMADRAASRPSGGCWRSPAAGRWTRRPRWPAGWRRSCRTDLLEEWPRTKGGQLTSRAPVLKLHLDVRGPRAAGRAQDAQAAQCVRLGAARQGAPAHRAAAPRLPGGWCAHRPLQLAGAEPAADAQAAAQAVPEQLHRPARARAGGGGLQPDRAAGGGRAERGCGDAGGLPHRPGPAHQDGGRGERPRLTRPRTSARWPRR